MEQNWISKLTRMFVENAALASLSIIVVVAVGLLGFLAMPKQYNPDIERPAFIVEVAYPGATVREAYTHVATELVEKTSALAGVDEVTTHVQDGAVVSATVIFDVGYDQDAARVSLATQLTQHEYLARGAIAQPTIRELDPDTVPILTLELRSSTHSLAQLRAVAVEASHVVTNVEDVAGVDVYGGYPPAIVVELRPEDLARTNVSASEVLRAVEGASREFQLATLRDGTRQVLLDIHNSGAAPESLELVSVNGTVRLGDVATVYRGTPEVTSYVQMQMREGTQTPDDVVLLSVAKRSGASAPEVSAGVKTALQGFIAQHDDVRVEVVRDDGVMATREIRGLGGNLATSVVIVGLVLMLFLSLRSAVTVALAIPFTMLVVFALGHVAGETVNRITLFALILSLGLLVDAAIVIVEAAYRAIRETQDVSSRRDAVVRAVSGVGVGLFLSMLTSVVVFMPMKFISGMMGPYMGPISFFVPAALAVSFFVSITVLPYLAIRLIRADESQLSVARYCASFLDRVIERYSAFISWLVRTRAHQRRVLLGAGVLFVVALVIPVVELVHFQMLPKADRDQYYIHLDMPAGTDVLLTRAAAQRVAELALADTQVRATHLFVAEPPVLDFNGMFKGVHLRRAPHQATIRVSLTESSARGRSSTEIVEAVRARVARDAVAREAESVRFVEDPPGPPVMATFVGKVSGSTASARDAVSVALTELAAGTGGVVDVDTSKERAFERIELVIDPVALRAYHVSPEDVYATIALLGAPVESGAWHTDTVAEYAPIEVRLPRTVRDEPADLAAVFVKSRQGETVPLMSLIEVRSVRDREALMTEGTTPTRYVTAETQQRSIVYVMLDVIGAIRRDGLAEYAVDSWGLFGMTLTNGEDTVRVDWGGEWEMTLENFRDLGIAMGAALFLVYLLLVAQYRNFKTPGLILTTVPLGLVGILFGFMVLDLVAAVPLTATALIGFIALIGIVVNNAIILLERFEQARGAGLTYEDALRDATTSRVRPILLTSLTTVLASLTIAFDPVWSGLAWAIVFGLSFSALLTLVVFPALLLYTRE